MPCGWHRRERPIPERMAGRGRRAPLRHVAFLACEGRPHTTARWRKTRRSAETSRSHGARVTLVRMKRALLVIALLTLAPTAVALACSCMRSTPAEALERSTAVFEGRVLEVTPFEERRDVTLEGGCLDEACRESLSETTESVEVTGFAVRLSVTRRWKGVDTEEVVVRTARDSAACGFAFEVGQDYVVYASAEDEAGTLATGLCDRTARVADASEDLVALGTGEVPVDVDEEPTSTTDEPPARGGCASCAASGAPTLTALFPAAFALVMLRRRRL